MGQRIGEVHATGHDTDRVQLMLPQGLGQDGPVYRGRKAAGIEYDGLLFKEAVGFLQAVLEFRQQGAGVVLMQDNAKCIEGCALEIKGWGVGCSQIQVSLSVVMRLMIGCSGVDSSRSATK